MSNKSSAVADMGDRLATIHMGRKLGGCAPFGVGELGPNLTQRGLGRGLPPYHVAPWFIQPFGHSTPTSQTDTQERQRPDSIQRTVLQTVAKNTKILIDWCHVRWQAVKRIVQLVAPWRKKLHI